MREVIVFMLVVLCLFTCSSGITRFNSIKMGLGEGGLYDYTQRSQVLENKSDFSTATAVHSINEELLHNAEFMKRCCPYISMKAWFCKIQ